MPPRIIPCVTPGAPPLPPCQSIAATGWCLVSTGAPVMVVYTAACNGGPAGVTFIDPATGATLPAGALQPCGAGRDWEVQILCDVNPVTGAILGTYVLKFTFDEGTGSVLVEPVSAADGTTPYVILGEPRYCTQPQRAISGRPVCFLDGLGAVRNGWETTAYLDGVAQPPVVVDESGVVVAAPVLVACQSRDIEGRPVCFRDAAGMIRHGWETTTYLDGVAQPAVVVDETGAVVPAPVLVSCQSTRRCRTC